MNPAVQAAIAAAIKEHGEGQEAMNVSGGACFVTLLIAFSVAASVIALVAFL